MESASSAAERSTAEDRRLHGQRPAASRSGSLAAASARLAPLRTSKVANSLIFVRTAFPGLCADLPRKNNGILFFLLFRLGSNDE